MHPCKKLEYCINKRGVEFLLQITGGHGVHTASIELGLYFFVFYLSPFYRPNFVNARINFVFKKDLEQQSLMFLHASGFFSTNRRSLEDFWLFSWQLLSPLTSVLFIHLLQI